MTTMQESGLTILISLAFIFFVMVPYVAVMARVATWLERRHGWNVHVAILTPVIGPLALLGIALYAFGGAS